MIHQWNLVLSIYWDDSEMIMHPVSLGLHSDVCTWHWFWGWWKVHESETSAFTLFHQLRVSSKAWPWGGGVLRFRGNEQERISQILFSSSPSLFLWTEICVEIVPVTANMLDNTFPGKRIVKRKLLHPYCQFIPRKWRFNFHKGPGHGISCFSKQVMGHPGSLQFNNRCLRDSGDWTTLERTWTTPIQESRKIVPLGSLEGFSSL